LRESLLESTENLNRLDSEIIELEQRPADKELLASVFRTIHTIKGTCGFLGFPLLERILSRYKSSPGGSGIDRRNGVCHDDGPGSPAVRPALPCLPGMLTAAVHITGERTGAVCIHVEPQQACSLAGHFLGMPAPTRFTMMRATW
jgi:hypothetical protein